ncbi:MAG TPA: protein phosphatase 2C domain-containing protein [Bryobacteraceae bacterium]|nr:protein phosphatase 2C domain-containing protein [Bryobacteraceae bacterium]
MVRTNLKYAAASDPGMVRRNNEDAYYADPDRGIFLVVDGIGGQAAGEKAAEIAVQRVRARLERQTGTVEQRIREAITVANNAIFEAARTNPEWEGMACVLTLAVFENGDAVVGHVGDSRLYQIRRGEIRKVTHDHSPVGEREENGELTELEAMTHPRRNEVFRDVGSEAHEPGDPDFIELQRVPFQADSAVLLCSDGLSDLVPSPTIRRAVETHAGDPESAVRELIAAANTAGGKDNVTVVLVEGPDFATPAPVVPWSGWSLLASRGAVFFYGLALAAAGMWFTRDAWNPKPPPEPKPRTLVVGAGEAYSSIGDALAAARAGDTVEVRAGEYSGQVRLKSGVNLLARDAILRASELSKGPAVLAEGVRNAQVTGLRIVAGAQDALPVAIALADAEVRLEEVDVSGAETGIEIRGRASPTLRADSIHDCKGTGILIMGDSAPWISHTTLRANKTGLAARDGARPALEDNVFDKNTLQADLPPEMLKDARAHNIFIDAKAAGGRKQ